MVLKCLLTNFDSLEMIKLLPLVLSFSGCGHQTSSVSITWELVKIQILRPHSRLKKAGTMRVGSAIWYLRILMHIRFENHGALDIHKNAYSSHL